MFKEGYKKHQEELAKLNRLEYLAVKTIPFIFVGIIIYIFSLII